MAPLPSIDFKVEIMHRPLCGLFAVLLASARAPQQGFDARGQPRPPAPQPIQDVLMQVFDKDMSKAVTMDEATQTLDAFAAMGGAFQQPDGGPNEIGSMIEAAKRLAPSMFALLDADGTQSAPS